MLKTLPDESVHCCVTSPPYWGLRDYGVDGQLGLEKTPEEYTEKMTAVFREVRRVLRPDGTLFLNLGDSYASNISNNGGYSDKSTLSGFTNPNTKGRVSNENYNARKLNHGLKPKDLVGIPWLVAFALRADGWYLRCDIIWHKPNPMPESVTDRPTKAHEYIFLLSKSERYFYDNEAIKVPVKQDWGTRDRTNGKYHNEGSGLQPHGGLEKSYEKANRRSVWSVTTKGYKEAHFATFPPDLIIPCILAGCPEDGTVLDPFFGSGTTGLVASRLDRQYIGIELNGEYVEMAKRRIEGDAPLLNVGVLPL
jgi:DNA modification methylase